jgi:hypothetical protein
MKKLWITLQNKNKKNNNKLQLKTRININKLPRSLSLSKSKMVIIPDNFRGFFLESNTQKVLFTLSLICFEII